MTDILVHSGTVITQNETRDIIHDGAVSINNGTITGVGSTSTLVKETDPERTINADGQIVLPGLINAHVHVSDILLRNSVNTDRSLLDWLFNIKQPGVLAMTPDEHGLAAELYCAEAISGGITTFVENDTALDWDHLQCTKEKLDVYADMGIRTIYGAGIRDAAVDRATFDEIRQRPPDSIHPGPDALQVDTNSVLEKTEQLIQDHHDPTHLQSIWPAPVTLATVTPDALRGAYELAEQYDVMTTAHVAEATAPPHPDSTLSSIEYLRNVGYLGPRALLGHCVQTDQKDIRILAETQTAVAHNYQANMRLATGFAPTATMFRQDVTVSVGTDNSILNDTIDLLKDIGALVAGHRGYHRDPGALSAQEALDMITCDAAAAIDRSHDLGSIVEGKRADIILIDIDQLGLTPSPDPIHTLVHAATGRDVTTVICDGHLIMDDGNLQTLRTDRDALLKIASETAADINERAGISSTEK
ncbi:amidohydrolase family protein [Salinarchaeum sp. IM2453]|uniref:amidohydrolase family protein n=1 Tax=Salinarchaeum sp. IM2453 TaxID=2862870 RepID=UPI001C83D8BE|nr:amidohydrolase family protein [Salinarchaeum sp. IM2453]QZA87622.1 amidohydrolase family protein [Salinarchaeum sp. IM2453]